jgi:hypothetical protein
MAKEIGVRGRRKSSVATDPTSRVVPISDGKHFWRNGKIGLFTKKTLHGRMHLSVMTVDVPDLPVNPCGLLSEAIECSPAPLHYSVAYALRALITVVCKDGEAANILNSPPSELTAHHLTYLYAQFDQAAAATNFRKKATFAVTSSRLFRNCPSFLASGELVSDVQHKAGLTDIEDPPKQILSSHYDGSQETEFLRQPLNVMNIGDGVEREAQGIAHLRARTNALVRACSDTIRSHYLLIDALKEAQARGLPENLAPRSIQNILRGGFPTNETQQRLKADERLDIAVYLVHKHEIWKGFPERFGMRLKDSDVLASATYPLTQLECRSTILSQFFAPRLVQVATLLLVQAETGWNAHTVISLTADNIIDNGASITLGAVKSRTNELQSSEISKIEAPEDSAQAEMRATGPKTIKETVLVSAIRALLVSRANIDKYCSSNSNSIFCILDPAQSGPHIFRVPLFGLLAMQFFEYKGLPRYGLDEIRGQFASSKYLENNRNLFKLQALLGHADPATTAGYLRTVLMDALGESRMVQFMSLLQSSIQFAVGKGEFLTEKALTQVRRNNLLLFPTTSLGADNAKCAADQWLDGDQGIEIGTEEIHHCALQREYYRANMNELLTADEERFAKVHFGRIIFCEALYRIILTSEFASVLREIEAVS